MSDGGELIPYDTACMQDVALITSLQLSSSPSKLALYFVNCTIVSLALYPSRILQLQPSIMDILGHCARLFKNLKLFVLFLSKAAPAIMEAGSGRAVSRQFLLEITTHKSWEMSPSFYHLYRVFLPS